MTAAKDVACCTPLHVDRVLRHTCGERFWAPVEPPAGPTLRRVK